MGNRKCYQFICFPLQHNLKLPALSEGYTMVGKMGARTIVDPGQRQPHSKLRRAGFGGGADAFRDHWSFHLSCVSFFIYLRDQELYAYYLYAFPNPSKSRQTLPVRRNLGTDFKNNTPPPPPPVIQSWWFLTEWIALYFSCLLKFRAILRLPPLPAAIYSQYPH